MLQIQGACRRDEIPAAHPPWAASTFDVEKTWRTDPTASLSCALTSSNGFKLILCQNIAATTMVDHPSGRVPSGQASVDLSSTDTYDNTAMQEPVFWEMALRSFVD